MAEEKKIIIDIEIDAKDIKSATDGIDAARKSTLEYQKELNLLKKEQQTLNALYKDGKLTADEYAKGQLAIKQQMTSANKQIRDNNKTIQNNKTVVDAAKGSNDQLKARLSLLTKEYNSLSKEQRENSKEGRQMESTIKAITDKLKNNEDAVGNNRRSVGDYKNAIIEAAEASGGFGKGLVGMASGLKSATLASLKFLATPLGAVIGAIGLAIGLVVGAFKLFTASLNRTEDGAAALTGVMNVFKGVMSGVLTVVEPIALFLVEGLADGFEKLGNTVADVSEKIQSALNFLGFEDAANGLAKLGDSIKEASIATSQLAKAEAELNRITREQGIIQLEFQNRAEKLRQIRDDESISIRERIQANKDLADVLTEQSDAELALANRSLEIANLRIKAEGESTDNLDKRAEAELKISEIQERITSQRSEQLTNENSLIRDGLSLAKEANTKKIAFAKNEIKVEKKRAEALIKGFQDERKLIDEAAEADKNNAIIRIENAEQRAKAVAFIEREALFEKLRSIEDETAAYTASADSVGSVDEVKFAKQLAERAAFEAEIASIDRAAKAEAFTNQIELLQGQEQLDIEAAELSIENTKELEQEKARIALEFLTAKLALMREFAAQDDILTEKEIQNLQRVENAIKKIQDVVDNPEGKTIAEGLGISDEDIEKIQLGLTVVSELLSSIQSAITANAENRLREIDDQSNAEIAAVEKSTLSEKNKKDKIKAIEKKAAQERFKIELAQFKVSKALSVALAIANTATAVMAQLSNPTPYVGFVLAALAAVTGAVNIGIASSTKPPSPPSFARGGYVSGAGTSTSDSIDARLSDGESVNNAKTTAMFGREISAMNAAGGGVDWYNEQGFSKGGLVQKFAHGGVVGSTQAARQASASGLTSEDITRAMTEALSAQPAPIVSVTDINRVNRQTVMVKQTSDL